MALVLNGSGSITGLSAGGLPDGSVTADDIASTLDLSGKTVTLAAGGTGYGKVLQVVNADTSTQVGVSSNSFTDTGLTATITPTSATSKILVIVHQNGCGKLSTGIVGIRLYRGATEIAQIVNIGAYTGGSSTSNYIGSCSISYLDSPATTSATTYKTRVHSENNTSAAYVQIASEKSTITLMEIAA